MTTQIYVVKAISRPSHDQRTSVCTLQPFAIPMQPPPTFSEAYWVDSPVSTTLGLPLKLSNLATHSLPIPKSDAGFLNFRKPITNDDAVLNNVANRLFTDLDTTSPGFGEARTWKFWDTVLIARADGKALDIEYLHAMDHFLRGRIREIRAHAQTFVGVRRKVEYLRGVKDSSFTAKNMAATWEAIKADGIAKGFGKYEGMGNPFRSPQTMRKGMERIAGVGVPKTCAGCGGASLWLEACVRCEEVWYCGSACEGKDRVVHQGQCGGMEVDT